MCSSSIRSYTNYNETGELLIAGLGKFMKKKLKFRREMGKKIHAGNPIEPFKTTVKLFSFYFFGHLSRHKSSVLVFNYYKQKRDDQLG